MLDELEGEGRVLFRYVGDGPAQGNPNGALRDIAGICSADGRVAGLMPHPEHAIDALTGPTDDGLGLFVSVQDWIGTVGAPVRRTMPDHRDTASDVAHPTAADLLDITDPIGAVDLVDPGRSWTP